MEEGTRWKKGTEDGANGGDHGEDLRHGSNTGWKKVEGIKFEQNHNLNLGPKSKNQSSKVTPAGLPPLPPQKLVHDTPTVPTEAR